MRRKTSVVDVQVDGDEVSRHMMDLARSFCSYLKHGERAKLKRRAIASANPILRMFITLIEDVHLGMAKDLEGATISIGGEEKKNKINATLQSSGRREEKWSAFLSTQDMTKWNECLSADLFALFHHVMLDDELRLELELPRISQYGKLFREICMAGHFLLATKM